MAKKMKAWIKTIRQLFSSEELTRLARKVGFIQRQRSLTAEYLRAGNPYLTLTVSKR
ncbi:hypothetical protein [Parageobacillus galactosidasius]|uniref:hypothetical protein n=1 Tax=Parageobacillus galactosidasius TaxID=883812 RepID=UPI00146AEEA0|nr:hypothetical protein [Parageobacillus galactosidasius]